MILTMTTLALSIVAAPVAVLVAVSVIVSMAARRFTAKVEMALARVQNLHLYQVEDEAHYCDDEHNVALDLWRFKEAHRRLIEKPASHYPDAGDGDKGADNLSPMPTVGKIVRCRLL